MMIHSLVVNHQISTQIQEVRERLDNDSSCECQFSEPVKSKGAETVSAPLLYDSLLLSGLKESDFGFPAWFVFPRP